MLLDSRPLWLSDLDATLAELDIRCVAKWTVPTKALEAIQAAAPGVAVLELDASDAQRTGYDCLREARAHDGALRLVGVVATRDSAAIQRAFDLGANAVVVKTARSADIGLAVRQVFERSIYIKPEIATQKACPPANRAAPGGLTHRECEMLVCVASGMSNAQIARKLWVAEQTVKFHLGNVYRKLRVENRTQASSWAYRNGLIPVAESEPAGADQLAGV